MFGRLIVQNLIHQFAFNLFQRFAFGFRQFEFDEQKSRHANSGVKPERSRRTEYLYSKPET